MKVNYNAGFTLAELVVSMAIISIIVTVLLGNRDHYSERLILKNQTYNVVLLLRQAQVDSLGVKASGGNFNASYGVLFNLVSPSQIKFFTDQDYDGKFDVGETNQDTDLQNDVTISKICMNNTCNPGTTSFTKIAITFSRPDSAAIVKAFNGFDDEQKTLIAPAMIHLRSKTGLTATIKVDSTGGVSIEQL